ncbi:MAG: hypothetical protein P4M09_19990 [Devosia sp.]|nr:hypothetical protein [Devosia sp.]
MSLGTCKIRSAGRTSGSIEVTLPPALQAFTGLGCRVVLRDGVQPEIVLQPDLAGLKSLLRSLWGKLALALGAGEVVEDFNPSLFMLTLLPPRHWQTGLPLAYADALTLTRRDMDRTADDLDALARVLTVMAAAIGRALGLEQPFALGFGDAVAYAVTEASTGFGADFERSLAAGLCRQARLERPSPVSPFSDEFWMQWEPVLRRIRGQFVAWQNHPDQHHTARQQWYRAQQCESLPGRPEAAAAYY